MSTLKRILPLILLSLWGCARPSEVAETSLAYDNALLLAARSERIFEVIKPLVVQEIVEMVRVSKMRSLSPIEKDRLDKLNALRKSGDEWARLHNAYLDILGGIEYFQEKPDRDARDNARLAQLLAGLPRNNENMVGAMSNVTLAARTLGLKGAF